MTNTAKPTTLVVVAAQVGHGNTTTHRAFGESDKPERGFFTACGSETRGYGQGAVRKVERTEVTCKRCGVGPVTR